MIEIEYLLLYLLLNWKEKTEILKYRSNEIIVYVISTSPIMCNGKRSKNM